MVTEHVAEHIFKGTCICPCRDCKRDAMPTKGPRLYGVLCTHLATRRMAPTTAPPAERRKAQ
jgi:hypothetical protein